MHPKQWRRAGERHVADLIGASYIPPTPESRRPDALPVGTPLRIGQGGYSRRGTAARTAALVTDCEFATYCAGDRARAPLVFQIERIVAANQTPGDGVGRNSDQAAIAAEMHAAVDGTAFERNSGRPTRGTGAGVVYLDMPVDDVTRTVYFFGTEDKSRGSVRDQPAVDRGGAYKQYSALVDPHAARYVRSAQEAKITGVDDHTAVDGAGKRCIGRRSCITGRRRQ